MPETNATEPRMNGEHCMMIVLPCILSHSKEKPMNLVTVTTLLLLLWLLPSALPAQCANSANIHSFVHDNKTYEVVKENLSWSDAAACAVQRGGKLAEIDSPAEQSAIYLQLSAYAGITITSTRPLDGGGAGYVWLGGTDRVTEGTWIWDGENSGSGTQFWQGLSAGKGGYATNSLYTNWGNEPDNYGAGPTHPGQDALAIALSNWPLGMAGQWNDVSESNQLYYIVEHPGIVPVELISFAAEDLADGVRLEWHTATETNNLGWSVQRRIAGGDWTDRGFVPGAGTTTQAQRYRFVDAVTSGDVLEYRLRQVDLDGSVEYSHPLRVHAGGSSMAVELLPNHPNPFNNQTTMSYYIEDAQPATLVVTDFAGREVMRIDHAAGGPSGLRTARFDASLLPPGVYFCRLVSGSLIHTRAMLLLR